MPGIIDTLLIENLESRASVIPDYEFLPTHDEMSQPLDPTHSYLLTWDAQTLSDVPGATHYIALYQDGAFVNVQAFGPSPSHEVRSIQAHWVIQGANGSLLQVKVATNTGRASFLQRLMVLHDLD